MGAVNALPASASSPWWHREFASSVSEAPLSLAPAAFRLSAHGSRLAQHPDDLIAMMAALHELASDVSTIDEWRHRVFVDAGFTGNGANYHDVRNSFLPDVLSRRLGLPITLALVGHLVAEMSGLVSWGIGMPGHFLLGIAPAGSPRGVWQGPDARVIDAFNGGRTLDEAAVTELFATMFGPTHRFQRQMLNETTPSQVLLRMLNNLKSNYANNGDLNGLCAVARLRTSLPDWSFDDGRELLRLLTVTGSLDEAAATLEALVQRFPHHDEVLDDERIRLSASLN